MFRQFRFPFEKIVHRWIIAISIASVSICGCGFSTKPEASGKFPKLEQADDPAFEVAGRSPEKGTRSENPAESSNQNPIPDDRLPGARKTMPDPTPPSQKFTDAELHKNKTLLVLIMEPDIRAMELIKYLRGYLTEEQKIAAIELVLEYDETFLELRRRRAAILEDARDGTQVAEQLQQIKMETVIWSTKVRVKVEQNIMTEKQRQQRKYDRAQAGKG